MIPKSKWIFPIILLAAMLGGCSDRVDPEYEKKLELAAAPRSPELVAKIQKIIYGNPDHFTECISDGEKYGRPLDDRELKIAKKVGVEYPEKVRVVTGERFVEKRPFWESTGHHGHTCGYVMFFSPKGLVFSFAHELTHVAQMERFGSPEAWAFEYLITNTMTGYEMNPWEHEANQIRVP